MAGENEAKFIICSSVSEALSYMPCPLQYTEPSNHNELFVFWSQHNDEFSTIFPTAGDTTVYPDTVKEKITHALKNAYISDYYACWLVLFWVPVTINDQIFLTTCDLPFGLTKLHEGLCLYRSECLKYRIPVGTDNSENANLLGPTGRVFTHGLPEMSPDVSLYSASGYPQHDLALTAGLGNYLALPVFEPLGSQCAGVLEIIGNKKGSFYQELVQMVYEMLKKVDLRSSNIYDHPDKKGFKGLERALKELEEQLPFICRTHQLSLAQTWLPILDKSNIERFVTTKEQFCICTSAGYEFRAACDMFHLGKSQGVVGRAFLSRDSCFCSDITQLKMSEYPLAHVARKVKLHSSFAVCLQSSYTGDYVYLLEFFLPQDSRSDCRSPQTLLHMLLATMKRQFRSFKLASGQKLGEKLFVEVMPVPSDNGLNSFALYSAKPSPGIEAVARPEKILWFDPLTRLLKNGDEVNLHPENIDLTTSSTSNTITKVTNVGIQTNRVVFKSSEEESRMKISEGQCRINSTVLQQSIGAEVNETETTLVTMPTIEAATLHDESTIPEELPYSLHSGFPANELESSALVKILSEYQEIQEHLHKIPEHLRGDCLSSIVYETNARVTDPVYGCVGAISSLQQQVDILQALLTQDDMSSIVYETNAMPRDIVQAILTEDEKVNMMDQFFFLLDIKELIGEPLWT